MCLFCVLPCRSIGLQKFFTLQSAEASLLCNAPEVKTAVYSQGCCPWLLLPLVMIVHSQRFVCLKSVIYNGVHRRLHMFIASLK
jgi:hypothetical protein